MNSLRKISKYFFIYLLLLLVNFFLIKKIDKRNRQITAYKQFLAEITEISQEIPSFEIINKKGDSKNNVLGVQDDIIIDPRVANLKYFFRRHNSVLYDFSEFIVKTSDKYDFDYRLLPAIAMQESNLCAKIYANSHNCWGWGIYGNKVTRFDSYEEAIETISKGLKRDYIDKGLTTIEDIMTKYTPPSTGSWARGVNFFLRIIE